MNTTEHNHATLHWDRPGTGLYDDGSIRIITLRDAKGEVVQSHQATPEEQRWVLLLEAQTKTMNGMAITSVITIEQRDRAICARLGTDNPDPTDTKAVALAGYFAALQLHGIKQPLPPVNLYESKT